MNCRLPPIGNLPDRNLLTASYGFMHNRARRREQVFSILNERTQGGYVIVVKLLCRKGDVQEAREIAVYMSDRFPDYRRWRRRMPSRSQDIDGAFEIITIDTGIRHNRITSR